MAPVTVGIDVVKLRPSLGLRMVEALRRANVEIATPLPANLDRLLLEFPTLVRAEAIDEISRLVLDLNLKPSVGEGHIQIEIDDHDFALNATRPIECDKGAALRGKAAIPRSTVYPNPFVTRSRWTR